MTTELGKPLRRAVQIQGRPYVVTLHEAGFKLVEKGHRLGLELAWDDLVSGEAALAVALSASLQEPGDRKRAAVKARRSRVESTNPVSGRSADQGRSAQTAAKYAARGRNTRRTRIRR